jgi:hypothetical protein
VEWSEVSDVEEDNELPKVINVLRMVSYSVEEALTSLQEFGEYPEPTIEDVMNVVATWASEDFGCDWNHPVDPTKLVYTDEYNNILYAPGEA